MYIFLTQSGNWISSRNVANIIHDRDVSLLQMTGTRRSMRSLSLANRYLRDPRVHSILKRVSIVKKFGNSLLAGRRNSIVYLRLDSGEIIRAQ